MVYSSYTRALLVYTRLSLFGWFFRAMLNFFSKCQFPERVYSLSMPYRHIVAQEIDGSVYKFVMQPYRRLTGK